MFRPLCVASTLFLILVSLFIRTDITNAEDVSTTRPAFLIGPVAGLTTTWHPAPGETAIPSGQVALFGIVLPTGSTCRWTGAHEQVRADDYSIAICPLTNLGPHVVRVDVHHSTREIGHSTQEVYRCSLDVVDISASEIAVIPPTVFVNPLPLHQGSSNEATMEYYFGESIAALYEVGGSPNLYRTSVNREVSFEVGVSPPEFGPLMEWRNDEVAFAIGASVQRPFSKVGVHDISVGPADTAARVSVETYRVAIISHQTGEDTVPEGRQVTFEAVTDPPGYEDEITWLSSTKYGSGTPVLGHGSTFTVAFEATYGPHPEGGMWQWLGVKAANARFNQDSKELTRSTGVDLFESSGSVELDLPADFFGVGSDPFTGTVSLVGAPLETRGPFELGTTDTVVERLSEIRLPGPPSEQSVFVELVELSLSSPDPIVVSGSGPPEEWNVFLGLGANGPSAPGTMNLQRSGSENGTFSMELPIVPVFRFERAQDGEIRVFEPGERILQGSDGTFGPLNGCSANEVAVSQLQVASCFSIDLSSADLELSLGPPSADPNQPPPVVDAGANVDPNVGSLGRGAVISSGATIGAGAVIGPNAFIGANAQIGELAVVGRSATIGPGCIVGPSAVVDAATELEAMCSVGQETVIQQECFVGANTSMGTATQIGDRSIVGSGVQIGNFVDGGKDLSIGDNVVIGDQLFVVEGAQILPGMNLDVSLVRCLLENGQTTLGTVSECQLLSAVILGLVPGSDNALLESPPDQQVTPIDPNNLPAELQGLADDINDVNTAPMSNGGRGRNYRHPQNDCDDFAEDLRVGLAAKGYDTTFTVVYDVNKDRSWWQIWKDELQNGHCLTDLHQNGMTIWLESQFTAPGAVGVDLDENNDGTVMYATSRGSRATDGNKRIEVYDSAEAAEQAGRSLD